VGDAGTDGLDGIAAVVQAVVPRNSSNRIRCKTGVAQSCLTVGCKVR
jgi:hypothetical protein